MNDGFVERFSSDNACRENCLDRLLFFFNSSYQDIEKINNARGIVRIAELIQNNNLNILLYFHKFFALFPIYWKAKLHLPSGLVTTNLDLFLNIAMSLEEKSFLHLMTAKQVYDIDETWSHFICEMFDKSQRFYYDPFLARCIVCYPKTMFSYKIPNHEEILQKKIVSILVWR